MLYFYFKKIFLGFKKSFYMQDKSRLESQVYPKDVKLTSFSYGDDNYQQINVYKMNDEPKPLLIDIHGGAWVYGDKDLNNMFCFSMCQRGFDVISIGYRLVDDVILSGMVEDIFSALKFIKENQKALKIDLSKVYLTGDSAGGHLALLTAVLLRNKKLAESLSLEEIDLKIDALCLNHAVPFTNIAGRIDGHKIISKLVANPGLKRMLYGKNFKKNKWYKLLVSPSLYINKDTDLPRLMILTSKQDVRYYYQSQMLHDLLKNNKIEHEYLNDLHRDAFHVYNIIYPESIIGTDTNNKISEFFKNR